MENTFSASLDNWARGITLGVSSLFVLIVATLLFGTASGSAPYTTALVAVLVLGGVLVFCFLLRPLRYRISEDNLYVERPIGNRRISLADVEETRAVATEELRWTLRTFGNGGIFGFYGNFWNSKLGHMTWYATRRNHYVLVKTASDTFILTPDDPDALLAALARMPVPVAG